ncbi:peptidoglycan-binding protein [Paenibacillus sp. PK3_47]|uniref:LysM peptidoglycan-binding domain-containing protein n=1 Tax=Paenibacillus sp. PK3_47 TaxID=2072642 RepID=UPI00201D3F31|nr:LysM peptidoglycan-binding domain-containing protein [Paenibacillus sp. PK3_47]UQZ37162.1 peptidoglycan-binding protein [Paenibacillus sp. PK3_47]
MLKYSTYRSIYDEPRQVQAASNHSASAYMNETKGSAVDKLTSIMRVLRQVSLVKLVLVLMLVISGFTVVGNVFAGSTSLITESKRVVVERGDTLWSIALENKPSNMKTAVYIEGIKQTSGLKDTRIKAGDVLTLPVY